MLMKKEIIENNKKLKEEIEKLKRLYETDRVSASEIIVEQGKEIEGLNNTIDKKEQFLGDNIKRLEREVIKRDNVINELEKWLDEKIKEYRFYYEHYKADTLDIALYKLQELKESGSNGD